MTIRNVHEVTEWFEVLETTAQSQTAVMILKPGRPSSAKMSVHKKSDQTLLLLAGELLAEVNGEKRTIHRGDTCIIPAGTPHRFENLGQHTATTFNVYSPPEYPAGEKG